MEENEQLTAKSADKLITSKGADNNQVNYLQQEEQTQGSLKQIYYLWISRFFVALAVVSMSFLVLASLSLFRLAPRVTVEPLLLIKNSDSDNLVETEIVAQDMASRDKIMKMFIRRYVELRNSIVHDAPEMMVRWSGVGLVSMLSEARVYGEFASRIQPLMEGFANLTFTRETEITSITRQGGARSRVWKVDFKTYDFPLQNKDGNQSIITHYWTASVTAHFNPARAVSLYRLINPLGFTVIRYVQTEVNVF